jgi:diguanylate cyclase (GGDEF)-like protein
MAKWRRWVAEGQPRDPVDAARWLAVLLAVAGLVTAVYAPITPGATIETTPITAAIGLAVVGAGVLVWIYKRLPGWLWRLAPYLTLDLIVADDLITGDASITSQIFLTLPVLFAAMQMRRDTAISVLVAAIIADAIILFPQVPATVALVDLGYVAATLAAICGVVSVTSERRFRLTEQLRRQAAIDPLTGLATRTVLDQAAETAMAATDGDGAGLILIDVDSFKTVNDTHGHPVGDQVLIAVARRVERSCRPDDVVGRLGGDELAVLLPSCTPAVMVEVAERILEAVGRHPLRVENRLDVSVSVSVGAAHSPSHATTLRGLYAAADEAMYDAKRSGKNQVRAVLDRPPAA